MRASWLLGSLVAGSLSCAPGTRAPERAAGEIGLAPKARASPPEGKKTRSFARSLPRAGHWAWQDDSGHVIWKAGSVAGAFDLARFDNATVVEAPDGGAATCLRVDAKSGRSVLVSRGGLLTVFDKSGLPLASHSLGEAFRPVDRYECHEAIEFQPQGSHILVRAGSPVLVDGARTTKLKAPRDASSFFSERGRYLAISTGEHDFELLQLLRPGGATSFRVANEEGFAVWISPDERYLAYSAPPGKISVVELSSMQLLAELKGLVARFEGKYLLLSDRSHVVAWDLEARRQVWRAAELGIPFPFGDEGPMLPSNGRYVVTPDSVVDVSTGKTLGKWGASGFGCGYQSTWKGDQLIFLEGGFVTFWRPGRKPRTDITECVGTLEPLLLPDSSAVVAFDGLWDLATETRRASFAREDGGIGVFGLSPDGETVWGSTAWGVPVRWQTRTGTVLEELSSAPEGLAWLCGGARRHCYGFATTGRDERLSDLAYYDTKRREFVWLVPSVGAPSGSVGETRPEVSWFAHNGRCSDGPRPAFDAREGGLPIEICAGLLESVRREHEANGTAASAH